MIKIELPLAQCVRVLLLALWFTSGTLVQAQESQPHLSVVPLSAGMHLIQAEVALTPEQRASGLMWRKTLGPNEGMIFVFEQSAPQCFWMQNTLLPLSVAFLNDDGVVVNLDEMKPLTQNSHCSTQPVRYVLEMNAGWFAKRGIKAGFKLQGRPFKS